MSNADLIERLRERADLTPASHAVLLWEAADALEAITTDEAVERAALGMHASHDRGDWDEELPVVQDEYLDMARAALTAATGGDDE